MRIMISFFFLLGVASYSYAIGIQGAVEEVSKTTSSFVEGAAGAVGAIAHEFGHHTPNYQQGAFQGYPPYGQYPIQYWTSFGINPIHGTSYCSCPAGFFNQGLGNQGLANQGFLNGFSAPGVGTLRVQQTSSVFPKGFGEVVQQTKNIVSHHGSGY